MKKLEKITNPKVRNFLTEFLTNRNVNVEFYNRVPEDKLDFRIVDTSNRKSDSVRESLGHQIGAEKDYLTALETGRLEFISGDDKSLKSLSRKESLQRLQELDDQLIEKLSNPNAIEKLVIVPWSTESISVITMLSGLNDHEILHTGWNLALMDLFNIERYPALREMWG